MAQRGLCLESYVTIQNLFLAIASSKKVYVFNEVGEEKWISEDHPSTVSAITWSNKNELATACYGRVTFFDIVNNKTNQKLEWQGSLVSMELSPDGDIVACGSQDNSAHFWRRSTGMDAEMTGYPGKPSHLSFDDSGKLLATSGSERITVWSFIGMVLRGLCRESYGTIPNLFLA